MAIRLKFNSKKFNTNRNKVRKNVINSIRGLRKLIYGPKEVFVPEIAEEYNEQAFENGIEQEDTEF